jgi:putative ABC transport system permease protein
MTKAFLRFFRWFCHPKLRNSIEGDLVELHRERVAAIGKRRADVLFAIDVLLLFRPGIIRPAEGHQNLNQYGMFKSYFRTAWRNLLRNKGYSVINIGGLALAMTVTILIGLWIFDELSYNKSFENYDRIGHVMVHNGDGTNSSNPIPLEWELRKNFSQDIKYITLFTWPSDVLIASGEKRFMEPGTFMHPDGAEIFSLKMVYGTRKALAEPGTIMISERLSNKLFGDSDPIGKVVRIKNAADARIGGVYEDFPTNSDFYNLNVIGSWDFLLVWVAWMKENQDRWDNNSHIIYVQLNDGVSFEEFSAKIKDLKKAHLNAEALKHNPELFVHPMSKWRLYSQFENRKIVMSDQLQSLWLYGIIGAFVLILACINFMNLSTARSEKRAKEVGIRKTMGSLRQQLIAQFLTESFITVAIAAVGAVVIALVALPYFNEIAGKRISFPWGRGIFWIGIAGFIFIAGLMAGSYPALYLSSFRPMKVLKARVNSLPRKVLVVLQFTVSVTLIFGTIIVYKQIQFAKNRPVGYSRTGLINVQMASLELYEHYDALRSELIQSGIAENVAKSSGPITEIWSNTNGFEWEGKPAGIETNVAVNWVTQPYGETIGWKFVEGRDFSEQIASDSTAIIITRTAAKYMGMKDPIDQVVKWEGDKYHVVGVVEDIVMGSPYDLMRPAVFINRDENIYIINVRLDPSLPTQKALASVASVFAKYNPSMPFQFSFVDEDYDRKFTSELRVGKLASVFAVLAILISLLGLFGLSAFVAEQRTKEIGIRKVIGASVVELWALLTKSFVALVAVACLIAFPISWYVLSNWLTRFEYRLDISPWMFPLVIIGALLVTLATVSYQTVRAAFLNPVESLKSD